MLGWYSTVGLGLEIKGRNRLEIGIWLGKG